jgi:hypothetical protein
MAFRAWRVPVRSTELYATSRRRPWSPGTTRAVCAKGRKHQPPDPDCSCGIHAFHELSDACLMGPRTLVGAVAAWGDIEVYERGIRAEYARIVALAKPPRTRVGHQAATALADHYGVPLTGMKELAALRTARNRVPLPRHVPTVAAMLVVDRSRLVRRYGTLGDYREAIGAMVRATRDLSLGIVTVGHRAVLGRGLSTQAHRPADQRLVSWLQLEGEHTPLDEALCLARQELHDNSGDLRRIIMVVSASPPQRPDRVIREASLATSEGIEIMVVGTAEADIELLGAIASHEPVIAPVSDLDTVLPEMIATVGATRR